MNVNKIIEEILDTITTIEAKDAFTTKVDKKLALNRLNQGYEKVRSATTSSILSARGRRGFSSTSSHPDAKAFNDEYWALPFDLHHVRDRHLSIISKYNGSRVGGQVRQLVELRGTVKAIDVVKAPKAAPKVRKTKGNAFRSTHHGECQLCGSTQRLPYGKLATHGYTKKWGFFSGVCPGSRRLPYEQSTDRIQLAIDNTIEQRANCDAAIADQEDGTGPLLANHYDARRATRVWSTVTLVDGVVYTQDGDRLPDYIPTSEEYLRQRRIDALLYRNKSLTDYIEWLQARIAAWKPRTLTPVED